MSYLTFDISPFLSVSSAFPFFFFSAYFRVGHELFLPLIEYPALVLSFCSHFEGLRILG